MRRLSGPRGFATLGLAFNLLKRGENYFERYGDTFEVRAVGGPYVLTRQPEVIWDVLVRRQGAFSKDRGTRGLSALLGWGLLTLDGALWRERHRLVHPHFALQALDGHVRVMREEARREVSAWAYGELVDLQVAMTRITLRTALRCLFGVDPELAGGSDEFSSTSPARQRKNDSVAESRETGGSNRPRSRESRRGAGAEASSLCSELDDSMTVAMRYFSGFADTQMPLPLWVPSPQNLRFKRARSHLRDALGEIISRVRSHGAPNTVLGALLQSRELHRISDADLRDEGITLLVAGHETSSLVMTYTLALLAQHQDQQSALRSELGGAACLESTVDLNRAALSYRVLLESMRLFPVTWALGREALVDTSIAGISLKKGTQVIVHQWAAHRHPGHFADPARFDPARFSKRALSELPKGLYAPFGAGPRVCIGQHFAWLEMLVILEEVVRAVRLELACRFPPKLQPSITARPRAPLLVKVSPAVVPVRASAQQID